MESADLRYAQRPQSGAQFAVLLQFSPCNFAQKRLKSNAVYNGLLSKVSGVKSLKWEMVEIDSIMYRGSNMKSIVASSLLRFPPYFYFQFGQKWLSATVFRHI